MAVTGGQLDGSQRHAQADDVGEHVAGVGQQRQRVGQEAGDRLDDEEDGDEDERHGQGPLMTLAGAQRASAVLVVVAMAHARTLRGDDQMGKLTPVSSSEICHSLAQSSSRTACLAGSTSCGSPLISRMPPGP